METLRFLHIPKTAGTTFTSILKRQYFGNKCFSFTYDINSDTRRYEALSDIERASITLFTGHAPIMTGIKDADNATTITFLRDPVSRVKSFCQHVSEGKSPYLINDFPPSTFNLDDFLDSGKGELSNLQAKTLINTRSCETPLFDSLLPAEARDAALDCLFNKISYFGLQEYFNESLIIFSSALNWKMPFYAYKNKKENSKLIQFKPRHLQKIAALNAIDIEIYNHAREHFLGRLNNVSFDEKKLKRLQRINKYGSPVIQMEDRVIGLVRHLLQSEI